MTFLPQNFKCNRGSFYASTPLGAVAIHTYNGFNVDTFGTITSNGYFPANFGLSPDSVSDNDYYWITTSVGNELCLYKNVHTNPTFVATISYNEFKGTFNAVFSGAWTSSPKTISIQWSIQNGGAYLMIPSVVAAAPNNAAANLTTALPGILTPFTTTHDSVPIVNTSAPNYSEGRLVIQNANPGIIISAPSYAGGAGSYGWPALTAYYNLLVLIG